MSILFRHRVDIIWIPFRHRISYRDDVDIVSRWGGRYVDMELGRRSHIECISTVCRNGFDIVSILFRRRIAYRDDVDIVSTSGGRYVDMDIARPSPIECVSTSCRYCIDMMSIRFRRRTNKRIAHCVDGSSAILPKV